MVYLQFILWKILWKFYEKFYYFQASVDIEKVAREVDVDVLQDNIEQLIFCNIDSEIVIINFDKNYFEKSLYIIIK